MPFYADQSRDQLRQVYVDAWRKHREGVPMEPVEAQVADIVALHPEYHPILESTQAPLQTDYSPAGGQSNPFLHMGLHLAVRDQIATDRPAGIRAAYVAAAKRAGSEHDAEHQFIECLAETMWEAQRSGLPPDEKVYLERILRLSR
jgi:hypothetical protein